MAAKRTKAAEEELLGADRLAEDRPVGGVPGRGRYLIASYRPVSLFSLKMAAATSSVGKTMAVPTPYSWKMALLDAGLRRGLVSDGERFVRRMCAARIRIGCPERAVVTQTIIKVRQEPKDPKTAPSTYVPAVAYREFVYLRGELSFALDLTTVSEDSALELSAIAPLVNQLGKRGSFVQFLSLRRSDFLGGEFTQAIAELDRIPGRSQIAFLDDFGPGATFEALNSFSEKPAKRDRDRCFIESVIPLGLVNAGPGFAEYER
jgi:hypothetical protein